MTLGEYHKMIRKQKRIKLVRMAEAVGVSPSVISRFENNVTSPPYFRIEDFMNYLGFKVVLVDKNQLQ